MLSLKMTLSGVLARSTSLGALFCTSLATLFSLAGGMEVGWFSAGTPGSPAGSDIVAVAVSVAECRSGYGGRWAATRGIAIPTFATKTLELSALPKLSYYGRLVRWVVV